MTNTFYFGTFPKTVLLASVLIPVPYFEQLIVSTVKEILLDNTLCSKLSPKTIREAKKLINEEIEHQNLHFRINDNLREDGFNVDEIEKATSAYLSELSNKTLQERLAYLAVTEILVGSKAKCFFNGNDLIRDIGLNKEKEILDHMKEESEHCRTVLNIYNELYSYKTKRILFKAMILHVCNSFLAFHNNIIILSESKNFKTKNMILLFKEYLRLFWLSEHALFISQNIIYIQNIFL